MMGADVPTEMPDDETGSERWAFAELVASVLVDRYPGTVEHRLALVQVLYLLDLMGAEVAFPEHVERAICHLLEKTKAAAELWLAVEEALG